MMSSLDLRSFDADSAQPMLDQLIAVYLEVYPGGEGGFHGADRYRQQITGHMRAPGWRLVTANTEGDLVGYAYGFSLPTTSRWWEGMRTPVPAGFTEENGRRTFAISEIMVRERWRRRGVAHALHEELLAGRAEERATLLVEPDNLAARSAYASWGWHKAAELRPHWEHAPLYDVLMLTLNPGEAPRRTAAGRHEPLLAEGSRRAPPQPADGADR